MPTVINYWIKFLIDYIRKYLLITFIKYDLELKSVCTYMWKWLFLFNWIINDSHLSVLIIQKDINIFLSKVPSIITNIHNCCKKPIPMWSYCSIYNTNDIDHGFKTSHKMVSLQCPSPLCSKGFNNMLQIQNTSQWQLDVGYIFKIFWMVNHKHSTSNWKQQPHWKQKQICAICL